MEYENQQMDYEDTDVKHEKPYLPRLTSVSFGLNVRIFRVYFTSHS